jgi:hypothetical protein
MNTLSRNKRQNKHVVREKEKKVKVKLALYSTKNYAMKVYGEWMYISTFP